MNAQPLIEARRLSKHFDVGRGAPTGKKKVVKAVDGVDFAIRRGTTLALVGESGCGKTTTARLLLRLETPTAGSVYLDGADIHDLPRGERAEFRRRVQAVFQDPWASLNPRMRVRDLVAEPLVANNRLSRSAVTDRVAEVLTGVGLTPDHMRNFPHEFSGGQRQRIAIASALISQPRVLILDEPVSALDVSIRSQIMNLLKDIQQRLSVTYLLVAHDLGTTRYMADRTAVMYLGRIVEIGDTDTVFEGPAHPYTQALFSAALPARPATESREIVLDGEVPSPLNPPSGCPFHTRCPVKIGRRCEEETPKLQPVPGPGGTHLAACHLMDDMEGQRG